ncbi:glycoside hydrolase family 20 protein [Pontibacter chitinilyticus]|uniref:glycoside hydrolase family 20 protein n=1 Tax=Pontibacter chitinilyticus TaxID=2674989 RepID=UPI00321BA3F0
MRTGQNLLLLLAGILVAFTALAPAYGQANTAQPTIALIPKPLSLQPQTGTFRLNAETKIYVDPKNEELQKIGQQLAEVIKNATGLQLQVSSKKVKNKYKNIILLTQKEAVDSLGDEGYTLSVAPARITLRANKPQGVFLGTQTIRQLLPAQARVAAISIPALEIADKPRYAWRGMHLDVSRHFFPVDFVKKYIDYLALHKMNTFHWHLTDDQGWRIEIKKYPELTEKGAYRNGTIIGHAPGNGNDSIRYGGFYTQDEIRDVVKYAQDRYITVVPEIEMPGHALAALTTYPQLSCTGGPFEVAQSWGVFKDVFCAGNEQTFQFLENVLTEVMDLFPSKVIHIGGDESPKERWKECPKCQARIAAEGLKDEHELQSYFIQRIEKFLNSKGRKIIGWDEILEGGLAPNADVMSWRGIEGGIAAAKQHHYVVMTPGSHVYFDHYQGDPSLEPLAIGGYTTLQKVYSFEPTPAELSPEEAKYILGAQANVWTEYIPTEAQVEYMVLPRMAALSEVLWTPAAKKNWDDFKQRMQQQYKRYDALGANYARSAFNVRQQVIPDTLQKVDIVKFETDAAGTQLYYTLDGSVPTAASRPYTAPFPVDRSVVIRAGSFENGELAGKVSATTVEASKAFAHAVKLTKPANRNYTASGPATLVDGLSGSENHTDGNWLGFQGDDLEAVIDLQKITPISRLSSSYLQSARSQILFPSAVEYAVSEDGKKFTTVKVITPVIGAERPSTFREAVTAEIPVTNARYIKVTARNRKAAPQKAGEPAGNTWVFADEITVE